MVQRKGQLRDSGAMKRLIKSKGTDAKNWRGHCLATHPAAALHAVLMHSGTVGTEDFASSLQGEFTINLQGRLPASPLSPRFRAFPSPLSIFYPSFFPSRRPELLPSFRQAPPLPLHSSAAGPGHGSPPYHSEGRTPAPPHSHPSQIWCLALCPPHLLECIVQEAPDSHCTPGQPDMPGSVPSPTPLRHCRPPPESHQSGHMP